MIERKHAPRSAVPSASDLPHEVSNTFCVSVPIRSSGSTGAEPSSVPQCVGRHRYRMSPHWDDLDRCGDRGSISTEGPDLSARPSRGHTPSTLVQFDCSAAQLTVTEQQSRLEGYSARISPIGGLDPQPSPLSRTDLSFVTDIRAVCERALHPVIAPASRRTRRGTVVGRHPGSEHALATPYAPHPGRADLAPAVPPEHGFTVFTIQRWRAAPSSRSATVRRAHSQTRHLPTHGIGAAPHSGASGRRNGRESRCGDRESWLAQPQQPPPGQAVPTSPLPPTLAVISGASRGSAIPLEAWVTFPSTGGALNYPV